MVGPSSAPETKPLRTPCYCVGAVCDDPSEWRVANRGSLLLPLYASDVCLAHALRRAGLPAIVGEAEGERETLPELLP